MVQSPSWEANWFAASQEIPRIFMEPEVSLPHLQASIYNYTYNHYCLYHSCVQPFQLTFFLFWLGLLCD